MSKQLIVEYMPFKPVGSLTESSGAAYGIPGGFVVQGVLVDLATIDLFSS